MRAAKIAQHTGALKAFSHLYVYEVMECTRSDLLERVEAYRPKSEQHRDSSRKKEVKEFSTAEVVDALMSCHLPCGQKPTHQWFVQENGAALSRDGARSVWRRIARKSGSRKDRTSRGVRS
jgi:hypothetical protein